LDDYRIAKFESDYARETFLTISRTADGDIIISIFGDGECRITTSGGQLRGEKLIKIISLFSEIIDTFNGEETNK
jgi:hypothetical protein